MSELIDKLHALPIWTGSVSISALEGGITNMNYLAKGEAGKFVIRVGEDILVHHVMRFNELSASEAAFEAGLSPRVIYSEPGILVLQYIEGRTLTAEDIQEQQMLERVLPLIKSCHQDIPRYLKGPSLIFWVFHVIRDYAANLKAGNSKHIPLLDDLLSAARSLETAAQPGYIVYGHNDLLPSNFLDDGEQLWLIDWDYAGFNSPLFDLGGFASNNGLQHSQEVWMLETYFEQKCTSHLLHQYQAMKCASLLRETMWSMVSEIHSEIDFDYAAYTQENLAAFRRAYDLFLQS
ncbi:choline/ethanolamine kinase family protein [Sneathiella glossodoripedis]|uniref:choline/ethanolamine kinase family protein n=1 Tax=Sneathiella glossodoripedis TaxID=418853 RepID=UPI000B044CA0|nr:choline/ethanolamine kinase family protein [Sneathiella glossodoripedis]